MEVINNILKKTGHRDLAELFKNSRFEIAVGSTYGKRLFSQLSTAEIFVPKDIYSEVVTLPEEKKNIILDAFLRVYPLKDHSPEICEINFNLDPDLQNNNFLISLEIRQNLIDQLILFESKHSNGIPGNLNWPDFLNRIWPLEELPSNDYRCKNAYSDLYQHTVLNSDFDTNYILCNYFNLLNEEDDKFFCFLELLVHPRVRTGEEQSEYVSMINNCIFVSNYKLEVQEEKNGFFIYKISKKIFGVSQRVKNIIFASIGLKPEIIFVDSISNDIKIVKNEESCLIYDQSIPDSGLLWRHLVDWYQSSLKEDGSFDDFQKKLFCRLKQSITSEPEKILFTAYYKEFGKLSNGEIPALIPQVYLHYDPYSLKQLRGENRLYRQRMDFLILFSNSQRVIIEIDGVQHYSENNRDKENIASPKKYAEMLNEDRRLRLAGYEIFRFGGYEFNNKEKGWVLIKDFFEKLFKKYGVNF
jgi:very-short-patch-repair endonuclease